MKLIIEIDCDNSVFEESPQYELTSLLFKITRLLETHTLEDLDHKKLLDSNGNTCGLITLND